VELDFLQLKPTSISRQLWLCRLSAQLAFTWAQQAGCPSCLLHSETRNSFKTESSVHSSTLLQSRYPTLGPKLCHEYLSNPLQINFLATGTLAANDFHSALPTPVRLLIYSRCFSWSRWFVCLYPINVSYLLHCCLYLSLELLSKGRCAQG